MGTGAIAAILLGAVALPAAVFFFVHLKRRQDELQALIERKFGGKQVVLRAPLAYLVAQESRALRQRQGHGKLILTDAGPAYLVALMDRNVELGPVEIEIESAAMRIRNQGEIRI